MTLSSRNLLKVYGDDDRRDLVDGVVTAIFGECIPDPSSFAEDATSAGSLLAAVRFDWPGEPPVGWVEELSRRMPGEAFELYSDPAPADWAPDCRVIIRGGQFLDGVGFGDTGWLNLDLPLSASPLEEPVLATQGPLDLVAIAVATLDRYYGYVYSDIDYGIPWKEKGDMYSLGSQTRSLETLLAHDEALKVTPRRAKHEERSSTLVACQRAADSLERACRELSSPHLASRLDEADRLAIERMRLLGVNLAGRVGSTQAVNVPEEAAAIS
ncbi:MAG: hypothetical protein ACKOEM_14020 [Planctomycetia bacterium]